MNSDPASRLLRWLRLVKGEADRLAAQASRLAERSEDLAWMIGEWERKPEVLARLGSAETRGFWKELQPDLETNWQLAAQAAKGAKLVQVLWQPEGDAVVVIDHKILRLPVRLAGLLELLVLDKGDSDDEFVAWKSRGDLLQGLKDKQGVVLGNHALDNLVSRLREALRDRAGLHQRFIQVNRRKGLRFALRRAVVEGEREPV